MIDVKSAKSITLSGKEVTQITDSQGNVLGTKEKPTPYEGLCFTAKEDNSTIEYAIIGSLPDINIQYSYNGEDGHDGDGTSISLMTNESIYVKNTANTLSKDTKNQFQFVMTGKISASGNCNSMINFGELSDYCYSQMFGDCDSLTTAPELPSTTLANSCYLLMFGQCVSLTTAPELPATTLAPSCYSAMFANCSSLRQAPELPATILAYECYYNMFINCIELITVPAELPATTLASHCYEQMFMTCQSLTTAPKLPATTLTESCYEGMFFGCISLKVNENGTGTKIFTCPSEIPTDAVGQMFYHTGGTFTDESPTAGNTYYGYE